MSEAIADLTVPKSYKSFVVFLGLLLTSLWIGFLVGMNGYLFGALIFAILIGLPLIYKIMMDTHFGLYFLTWYSYFLFYFGRLTLPTRLPVGVVVDILEIILLFGIIIAETKNKKVEWSYFNNPVTYILILLETYNLLQAFNPNATSMTGWLVSVRGIFFDLVSYFILVKLLARLNSVKNFTKIWLFFSLLAALYGIYQEIFGYTDFEWVDIYSSPATISLIQNWGILRKFSFFSDVATFGIVMAYSAIFCGVLAMYPFDWKKRVVLFVSALVMLVSMSFSGTRTATAMVPAGAFLYIFMHINNRRTLVILVVLLIGFVAILYGPFYGGAISRIRTTFEPGQDPSMNVREVNRARIQPYIHAHPIGGGVNTTDGEGEVLSPGHYLAGFATDSGFLKTALTIGWIGLIIQLIFYFTVISIGVKNFYSARNSLIKALYSAYIASFFSLLIANYAQSAMLQKPMVLIVFSVFVLMPNLIKLDSKVSNS